MIPIHTPCREGSKITSDSLEPRAFPGAGTLTPIPFLATLFPGRKVVAIRNGPLGYSIFLGAVPRHRFGLEWQVPMILLAIFQSDPSSSKWVKRIKL